MCRSGAVRIDGRLACCAGGKACSEGGIIKRNSNDKRCRLHVDGRSRTAARLTLAERSGLQKCDDMTTIDYPRQVLERHLDRLGCLASRFQFFWTA